MHEHEGLFCKSANPRIMLKSQQQGKKQNGLKLAGPTGEKKTRGALGGCSPMGQAQVDGGRPSEAGPGGGSGRTGPDA